MITCPQPPSFNELPASRVAPALHVFTPGRPSGQFGAQRAAEPRA
jgi:hypothetical protein